MAQDTIRTEVEAMDTILMSRSFSPSNEYNGLLLPAGDDYSYTYSTRDSSFTSTAGSSVQSPTSVAMKNEEGYLSNLKNLSRRGVRSKTSAHEPKTLVSWQSRQALKLSDPAAEFDESIEVVAVDISLSSHKEEEGEEEKEVPSTIVTDTEAAIAEPSAGPTVEPSVESTVEANAEPELNADKSPEVKEAKPEKKDQTEWDLRYAELLEYYNSHGHSNVRWGEEYGALHSWMERQKKAQRKKKLSQEKMIKLVAVEFDWEDYKEKSEDDDKDAASI